MVSLKALRTIVGISGLTLMAFAGGYFFGKEINRKKVEEQSCLMAVQERNLTREKKFSQDVLKYQVGGKLLDFKEDVSTYLLIHEDLSLSNSVLAINDLEGCILQELNDAEDFVLSLEKRNFSPRVIADANAFYKKINLAARDYVYRSKLERENPMAAESWYSPKLKRQR
jgi:hypothetical protein